MRSIIDNPTCGLDYKAEYERLKTENEKLREQCKYFQYNAKDSERENEILRAKLSIVHLIFGGADNG